VDKKTLLQNLPKEPGVYIMRDTHGRVLYVGKAKCLKDRVSSYFNRSGDDRPWIPLLPARLAKIDTMITSTSKEALLLENELIKRYRPPFNVQLKDDKRFLLIELDMSNDFPRLKLVRKRSSNRAKYFGPYHAAFKARNTYGLINRHFGLRTCSDREMKNRTRPCLQGQMGRCPAPCAGGISKADYRARVDEVVMFLSGKAGDLLSLLETRMEEASASLEFERAAKLRDQTRAVRATLQEQYVVGPDRVDRDIFGVSRVKSDLTIYLLAMRNGAITHGRPFHFHNQQFWTSDLVSSFLFQFYDKSGDIPSQILLPVKMDDKDLLEQELSSLARKKVEIRVPMRGRLKKLLSLSQKNASFALEAEIREQKSLSRELMELKKLLDLPRPPARIEAFDISHLSGGFTNASMSVLVHGKPAPDEYRRFKLGISGGDDYKAMSRVLSRRFRPGDTGKDGKYSSLPDLLLLDGGRQQLNVALNVLQKMGLEGLFNLAAIAKQRRKNSKQGDIPDRIFLEGIKNPIPVSSKRPGLRLLQLARDEAHRFGITYTRKMHRREMTRSRIENIKGVGKARAKALLVRFGSYKGIEDASPEEITEVHGIGPGLAEKIVKHVSSKDAKHKKRKI